MIKLHQFTKSTKRPLDFSPFCGKVEFFCKINGIPYEIERGDLRKTPKGKLPIAEIDGEIVCDSELILKRLMQTHNVDMEAQLSEKDRATSLVTRRFIEEHLYFIAIYYRWQDERFWPTTKKLFFDAMPLPARWIAPRIARRNMLANLHGQGMGRHTPDEVFTFAKESAKALSALLEDKPYFQGERPTLLDVTAFPFLYALLQTPIPSPLVEEVMRQENLLSYSERMLIGYF